MPFLDVVATLDESAGQAAVLMLNRDLAAARDIVLEWGDVAPTRVLACETLTGPDLKAVNTFADPRRVAPQPLDPPAAGARMTFNLPPRSYTVAHLAIRPHDTTSVSDRVCCGAAADDASVRSPPRSSRPAPRGRRLSTSPGCRSPTCMYELGTFGVLTDGYISRIPQSAFFGGGGGLAQTRQAHVSDVAAVKRVLMAIGGPSRIALLLTGHSHFDHSFDTATWSKLTNAPIIGSKTTCLQAQAAGLPQNRCRAVFGGERIDITDGVWMRVIRWNHSGDSTTNPEQHNPVELDAVPPIDPARAVCARASPKRFPTGVAIARTCLWPTALVDGSPGSSRTRSACRTSRRRLSSAAWITGRRSRT